MFYYHSATMAERAWSYAMELKQDNENDEFSKYFHMKQFDKSCQVELDSKTMCSRCRCANRFRG